MSIDALEGAPTGWGRTTLGVLCERGGGFVQTGPFGSQLHAADYVADGVPCIMPVNLAEWRVRADGIARVTELDATRLGRHRVQRGDIVFSRRGDIERHGVISEEQEGWLCGTGCLLVRPGSGADSTFVSMWLRHPDVRGWLVGRAVGSTMPNLNTTIMSEVPVALPPPAEQLAIAEVLGALDDKVELNRQMNRTLEEMASALFKSWFVDFDPVVARAEGRRPFAMDEAFDADLPTGWSMRASDEMLEILSGGTPARSEARFWGGDVPWFSVVDAPGPGQVFVHRTTERVTEEGIEHSPATVYPAGTVIVTARGTVGKLAVMAVPMAFNQSCYGLRPRGGGGRAFVYLLAKSLVDEMRQIAHGSVFDTITRQTFAAMRIPGAPVAVRDAFEAQVSPLFNLISANGQESRTLTALRDTLLPKLLSGEIRLKQAEKAVEVAV